MKRRDFIKLVGVAAIAPTALIPTYTDVTGKPKGASFDMVVVDDPIIATITHTLEMHYKNLRFAYQLTDKTGDQFQVIKDDLVTQLQHVLKS